MLINSNIDYFLSLYLYWPVDDYLIRYLVFCRRHLDGNLYDFLNDLLYDLRNENYLLNNSRDNNYFLDYPLNFNTFGDFNNLFNNLLLSRWHFFYSFVVKFLGNNLLFLDHNRNFFFHDIRYIFNNFHRDFLFEHNMFDDFYWNMLNWLYCFNEWNLMYFRFDFDLRNNDRDLNKLLDLSNLDSCLIDNLGNFYFNYLYSFYNFKNFLNDLYLSGRSFYNLFDSHYLLNDLWNLNNPFLYVCNSHYLLNYFLDDLYPSLYMWNLLSNSLVSNHLHNLFYYLRNQDNLFFLNYFLNDLLYNNLDYFWNLFFGLDISDYFFYYLYLLKFLLDNNLVLLHYDGLLDLDYLLNCNVFRLQFNLLSYLDCDSFI